MRVIDASRERREIREADRAARSRGILMHPWNEPILESLDAQRARACRTPC